MFVLDSHCDTPSEIVRGRDLSQDNATGHVDFPKIGRSCVDGAFFALYIPAELDESEAMECAMRQYGAVTDVLTGNAGQAGVATSRSQAYKNKAEGRFSIFLGLENGSPIGKSIDRIKMFYDKGIRYITLCHSKDNEICDSCASAVKRWRGLSPFGREVVAEMNRLGMLIDVSHVSDETFYDVLRYSTKPVVATHSCCRALCNHKRNMTDDMIKALQEVPTRCAVLDVTFPEPPVADSPLYTMPNVYLTPHIAGSLGNEVHRMAKYMAEEAQAFTEGAPTRFSVTLKMLETMA